MTGIPGYTFQDTIYEHGRARVVRALHGGHSVIVKTLVSEYPRLRELQSYRDEYALLRSVDSPGVARALDLVENGRGLAIVIEDFGGRSLRTVLDARGRLDVGEFLDVARASARALADVHDANIIHKDLNPANLVYNERTGALKIIDFNISSRVSREQPSILNYTRLEGTLAYISPEQTGRMNRSLDHRTDFYSLGVTFYELLTGRPPFQGDSAMELVHSHIALQPPPPSRLRADLPAGLSALLLKLMAKNAEDRYQSARGLLHDLEHCAAAWKSQGDIAEFSLGVEDRSERFRLPQRLYGRDDELARLLGDFDDTAGGAVRVLMVSGHSGMGKSSLVQELRRPLAGRNGWFLRGKFEQLRRDTPYSAVAAAFADLVKQLLIAGDLPRWRHQLMSALGANAGLLTDLIPELVHIIGPQPDVAPASAAEARNRFVLTFQDFVAALVDQDTPLVLFVDDLQWADAASLDLLERLVTNPSAHHVYVIGCYRDNEVGPEHPLTSTLERIETARQVSRLALTPLSLHHVAELVADAFGGDDHDTRELSTILVEKTRGNPFFVNQFLEALFEAGLIDFDRDGRCWRWDADAIRAQNMTDNVVELMAQQIERLSDDGRLALQRAALLGTDFDSARLAQLSDQDQGAVIAAMQGPLAEGLVFRQELGDDDRVRYCFLHDRVQQAAYASIPDDDRTGLHLAVGRMLRDQGSDAERDAVLFDMVEHLDQARALVTDPVERHALAQANLEAGRRAKASGAFAAALGYLRCADELQVEDAWERHYEHTRALHLELGEVRFLNGDVPGSEAALDRVIAHSRTELEKIPAYGIRIASHNARGLFADCIPVCLEALALLGIDLPLDPEQIGAAIGAEMGVIMGHIGQHGVESLADLPEMQDPTMVEAIKVLVLMTSTAFIGNPTLYPLVVVKQVSLSIQHGNAPESAVSYSSFAVANAPGAMENLDFNQRFGQLCQDVLDQYYVKGNEVNIRFVVGTFVQHWNAHLCDSLGHLRRCTELCLELGNFEYFIYSTVFHSLYSVLGWNDLPQLRGQFDELKSVYQRLGLDDAAGGFLMARQVALNLSGDADEPWVLTGDDFDEAAMAQAWADNQDYLSLTAFHIMKIVLCHLFDRPGEAAAHAEQVAPFLSANTGMAQLAEHALFDALRRLAAAADARGDDRDALLAGVDAHLENLERWAGSCPENHLHRVKLVQATRAALDPDTPIEALVPVFEDAARLAHDNGYRLHEGLALRGLARVLLARGLRRAAGPYLRDAAHVWELLGALPLVDALYTRHAELLGRARATRPDGGTVRMTTTKTLTTTGATTQVASELDFDSFLKAGHLLSSTLELDALLVQMVRVMVENAGAQAGAFVVPDADGWRVAAHLDLSAPDAGAADALTVPTSVLAYVARTRQPQLEDCACDDGDFVDDPVVSARGVRSLLCLPVLHKGDLHGLIYLENNLSAGAFTPERILTVELLARQAAISLDNAELYQAQARQAEAFSRFVPRQFLEFLHRDAVEDIRRGDSVQGDFTVLFTDLRDFTRLSESLSAEETFEFLNAYLDEVSPVVQRFGGFIDKFIGDAIMALFPGPADRAVQAGVEMLRVLHDWNARRQDGRTIVMGIGIHSGPLMLGTVGSAERMETTVVGDTVNLASRIEAMTKTYGSALLISESTHDRLSSPDDHPMRRVDMVRAAGKTEPITIFEVFADGGSPERQRMMEHGAQWADAVALYRAGDFEQAALSFRRYQVLCGDDPVTDIYIGRCERFARDGVPDDWDGAVRLSKG